MSHLTPGEGVINSEAAQDFIHIPGMEEAISPHDNLEWLCGEGKKKSERHAKGITDLKKKSSLILINIAVYFVALRCVEGSKL